METPRKRNPYRGKPVNIRIPLDILEFFRSNEPGYQRRIVDALREYALAGSFKELVREIIEQQQYNGAGGTRGSS